MTRQEICANMKWWWMGYEKEGRSVSEDEFFDLLDHGIISEFVEFLEIVTNKGYYIPFITTSNYLTHPTSRVSLKIKDYSSLIN